MVRKICPICEQVMGTSHYCRNCRSWVKHPHVREVNYYLNESHPANESDCSYHNAAPAAVHASAPRPSAPKSSAYGWSAPTPSAYESSAPKHSRSGRNAGLIAAAILIVILLLGSCVALGIETMNSILTEETSLEYDVDLGNFYGEEESWDADYVELEVEDVIAAGVECSSQEHFNVSGEMLLEPLSQILKSHDLAVTEGRVHSYNERYDNGTTWYATWTSYGLNEEDGGADQYAEVDYDTATGALHQIDLSLADPQVLAGVAGDALDLLDARGALNSGENCAQVLREELPAKLKQEGSCELLNGTLYISGYFDGENYFISIYRIPE